MHEPVDSNLSFTKLDNEDWSSLGPAFQHILGQPVQNTSEFEAMMFAWNRLYAFVGDTMTEIVIAASLNCNDEAAQKRKHCFITQIEPKLESAVNDYRLRVLKLHEHFPLPERYRFMLNIMASDREIFRQENLELFSQTHQLNQSYQMAMGKLVAIVKDNAYTAAETNLHLSKSARNEREVFWHALWEARVERSTLVAEIFSKQIALRDQIGKNAGFANFREYSFKELRRCYTAEQAQKLHSSIEQYIVPVARALYADHARKLGVETLRPWDISATRFHDLCVSSKTEPFPLSLSNQNIVEATQKILPCIDSGMADLFAEMEARHEMDLESRPGKRPGAYQIEFPFKRRPYIYCTNSGLVDDLYTTLHEFGHALHYTLIADEPLAIYRAVPMEAAELASMSCELIGHQYLESYFPAERCSEIRYEKYRRIALFLCYMAQVDAFQHWLYENPTHSSEERNRQWSQLTDRFGPELDWTGIEKFKGMYWQQQQHLFSSPFYYIEYGIAQLGALQIENNYKRNPGEAIKKWKAGLSLGATQPLPSIYEAAGIFFDFSPQTIQPVAHFLADKVLVNV